MTCPRCGAPVIPQARQCVRCGLLFDTAPPPMARPSRPRTDSDLRMGPPSGPPMQGGLDASGQWNMPADPRGQPPSASGQWPAVGDPRFGPQGADPRMMPMDPRGMGMAPSVSNMPSRPNRYPTNPNGVGGATTGTLAPGTVLQNGRLRVLRAYAPMQDPDGRAAGGFAQWVAADSSRRGDRVALLELPFGNMPQPQADRARESLTMRLASMEHHPDLQAVISSFSERGRHFLVLEHFDGEFLSDRVKRLGAVSERLVLNYASQMLDILEYMEKQLPPILHGAITPESVIITPDGGRARLLVNSPFIIAKTLNIPITVSGPLTPGYTSPEQQRGINEARSDLYSLGATLFFAATGFDSAARSAGIFPPARQVNPAISPPTEAVLAKAVRLVSSQRYQHADEMALDVGRAARGESPSRDPLGNLKPIFSRTDSRPGPLTIIGAVSVVLVAALIGLLVIHSQNAQPLTKVMPTATVNPTAIALAKQNEGLSTGQQIFDRFALEAPTGTVDATGTPQATSSPTASDQDPTPAGAVAAEMKAAQALRNNDFGTAVTEFQQAVHDDPSNPEARIYLADTLIAASPTKNYVTMEFAVSFASQDLETSRQALRGVSLAQDTLNQNGNLPGGSKVRIEIASIGATTDGAPLLAQYFTDQLAKGNPNHTLGVIPWPSYFANQQSVQPLLVALTQLSKAGVPTLAPIVTSDQIPVDHDLFSLSATDQYQGGVLAKIATSPPFSTYRVVIALDTSNIANQEIALTAAAVLGSKIGPGNVIVDKITSKTNPFDQTVHDVKFYGANLVIFAGNGDGAAQLALSLAAAGAPRPILASSNADSPVLLGQGSSPLAQLAKQNPQAMQAVSVLSLADPQEWDWISQTNNQIKVTAPGFFQDFGNTFALNTPITPDANAIYSYDALNLMIKRLAASGDWTATKFPTPQNLRDAIAGVTAQNPYEGVSGRIAFASGSGKPDVRPLVLKSVITSKTHVDAQGHPLLEWAVQTIIGGTQAFCSSSACTPS